MGIGLLTISNTKLRHNIYLASGMATFGVYVDRLQSSLIINNKNDTISCTLASSIIYRRKINANIKFMRMNFLDNKL